LEHQRCKVFELHLKFEELYTNLLLKVDEVAERILTLGVTPLHSFDATKTQQKLKVQKMFLTVKKGRRQF